MPCSAPPPLTDDQLSAFLDGSQDEAVAQHLAACESCALRMQALRTLDEELVDRLRPGRRLCPTPHQLGEYSLGVATPAEIRHIERHLDYCPRCQAELEALSDFLGSDAAPVQDTQPLLESAPSVRFDPRRPRLRATALRPAAGGAALRGSGRSFQAEVGSFRVLINVERRSLEPLVFYLSGNVLGAPSIWREGLVRVSQGGALLAVAPLDERGGFAECGPLGMGTTELVIVAPQGDSLEITGLDLDA